MNQRTGSGEWRAPETGRGLGPGSHGSGSVTATLSESDNDAALKTIFIANVCFQFPANRNRALYRTNIFLEICVLTTSVATKHNCCKAKITCSIFQLEIFVGANISSFHVIGCVHVFRIMTPTQKLSCFPR